MEEDAVDVGSECCGVFARYPGYVVGDGEERYTAKDEVALLK